MLSSKKDLNIVEELQGYFINKIGKIDRMGRFCLPELVFRY
jgi:hypothetical protein